MSDAWRRYAAPTLLVALLLLLAAGLALLVLRLNAPRGIQVLLPTSTPTPQLKAYVSGAVQRPGVYVIGPDDRVADLLKAAGGPTQDADLDRVNLAQRLNDADHIHIPSRAESPAASPDSSAAERGLININTASMEKLQELKGIGPALAQAIVDYRNEHGPFQRTEDLLEVKGIGPKTLEDLRPYITVR